MLGNSQGSLKDSDPGDEGIKDIAPSEFVDASLGATPTADPAETFEPVDPVEPIAPTSTADNANVGPPASTSQPIEEKKRGQRKSFTTARRELSEKELSSSAVLKLILDDVDRLEEDKSELAGFRERFHKADKKVKVLRQKYKTNTALEILSLGSVTVGAASIGYAPSVWTAGGVTPFMFLVFGVLLIGAGVGAIAVKS